MTCNKFFTLEGPNAGIKRIDDQYSFFNFLEATGSNIESIAYYPDMLSALKQDKHILKIENKKFYNCSFKNTKFININFTNCTFTKCLLMGTIFKNCKFIKCNFDTVNTKGIKFIDTYVSPESFAKAIPIRSFSERWRFYLTKKDNLKTENFANIGVQLYQSLLDNFQARSQIFLALESEYYFRHWTRILHEYNFMNKIERYNKLDIIINILWSFVGYGIKIKHYLLTLITVFILFCASNACLWDKYGIKTCYKIEHILQYTFYSCLSIGATPYAANSMLGISFAMFQGCVGWLLLGIGIGIILKRLVG